MRKSGGRYAIAYSDMPSRPRIHSFTQYSFIDKKVNQDRTRFYSHKIYFLDAEIDTKVNT